MSRRRSAASETRDEDRRPGWLRARDVLREAFARAVPAARVDVGRVDRLGAGLSRVAWRAPVQASEPALSDDWVALLPLADVAADVAASQRNEVLALGDVRASGFPFRVPEVLAAWETVEGEPVLVERFVAGVPLDLRAGRQPVEPWDIVGRIAAAIHAVPSAIPGPATRRAHALEELRSLTGLDPALRERAESWAREHLPPDEPSGLVHGDLLGQNIRLGLGEPDGVIDWACARRGDPAYDLSIVTRGARQPFQIGGGLDRLLASWHRAGGTGVLPEHVHVYELALLATQVTDGVHDAGTRLDALLRRLGA